MAQSKFKTGDRVCWKGDVYSPKVCGTVQEDSCQLEYLRPTRVWVRWDSDGKILQIPEWDLEFENTSNQEDKFTVENCINFLISQGYSVTISK